MVGRRSFNVRPTTARAVAGAAAFLSVVGLVASSAADTIILTNRTEYRGAILSADSNQVTILSNGLEWTFERATVASVKYDKKTAGIERAKEKRRLARARAAERAREAKYADQRDGTDNTSSQGTGVTSDAQSEPQVIVYGTSWCGYCRMARALLRQRRVPFIDKNIEQDPGANEEMRRKCAAAGISARGIPVLDLFGTIVGGYNRELIDELLTRHGY